MAAAALAHGLSMVLWGPVRALGGWGWVIEGPGGEGLREGANGCSVGSEPRVCREDRAEDLLLRRVGESLRWNLGSEQGFAFSPKREALEYRPGRTTAFCGSWSLSISRGARCRRGDAGQAKEAHPSGAGPGGGTLAAADWLKEHREGSLSPEEIATLLH